MDNLGIDVIAKKTIDDRVDYVNKHLPKCEKKGNENLKAAFNNTAIFMSEVHRYEANLERNFPNVTLKNRGVLLNDIRSFYQSIKDKHVVLISLNGRDVTYETLKRCEELIKKEDFAVKNLGEINKFDKIFSQAREMLRILLDVLKQKKVEFDNVDKEIGKLNNLEINFPCRETGAALDRLFEETDELIARSCRERYVLLQKEKDSIIGIAREIRSKIQDCVHVLDDIYCSTYAFYTGQNVNRTYTKIFAD